jgi:hypothetical protein
VNAHALVSWWGPLTWFIETPAPICYLQRKMIHIRWRKGCCVLWVERCLMCLHRADYNWPCRLVTDAPLVLCCDRRVLLVRSHRPTHAPTLSLTFFFCSLVPRRLPCEPTAAHHHRFPSIALSPCVAVSPAPLPTPPRRHSQSIPHSFHVFPIAISDGFVARKTKIFLCMDTN